MHHRRFELPRETPAARGLRRSCLVLSAAILVLTIPASAAEYGTNRFPCPPELQARVEFWVDIFSVYNGDQKVLHDERYPWIIYEVIPTAGLDPDEISTLIDARLDEYESIFVGLARKLPPEYNRSERRVARQLSGIEEDEKYRLAGEHLRTQTGLRDSFRDGLARSGRYIDRIQQILAEHRVPREIAYLPHVESAFNPSARSKAGAVGLWQFTRATGERYLRIERDLDERLDPIASTRAAARFLKQSEEKLESWPLAIVGYNHGVNGMIRAKARVGSTDIGRILREYDAPTFGFASENFYCEFLAAVEIASRPEVYLGPVLLDPPDEFTEFVLDDFVKFRALSASFRVPSQELARLNPALGHSYLTNARALPRGYTLRLPADLQEPQRLYASIPDSLRYSIEPRPDGYRVRTGDTLSQIARAHRITVSELRELNGIRAEDRIFPGQILVLP